MGGLNVICIVELGVVQPAADHLGEYICMYVVYSLYSLRNLEFVKSINMCGWGSGKLGGIGMLGTGSSSNGRNIMRGYIHT